VYSQCIKTTLACNKNNCWNLLVHSQCVNTLRERVIGVTVYIRTSVPHFHLSWSKLCAIPFAMLLRIFFNESINSELMCPMRWNTPVQPSIIHNIKQHFFGIHKGFQKRLSPDSRTWTHFLAKLETDKCVSLWSRAMCQWLRNSPRYSQPCYEFCTLNSGPAPAWGKTPSIRFWWIIKLLLSSSWCVAQYYVKMKMQTKFSWI
jgi:hypothetical protein